MVKEVFGSRQALGTRERGFSIWLVVSAFPALCGCCTYQASYYILCIIVHGVEEEVATAGFSPLLIKHDASRSKHQYQLLNLTVNIGRCVCKLH